MIKIERAYVGYKVTFSPGVRGWRGFSINAETTEQLHTAIEHWYEGHGHGHKVESCPVCVKVLSDQRKRNKAEMEN